MDAVTRREIFEFGRFRLDLRAGGLFRVRDERPGEPVALGSRALDVLHVLVSRSGELVSRDEIMTAVWPGNVVEESNVTVQIAALRRVLDADRSAGSWLQTVPGRGYRLVLPVTRLEAARAAMPRRLSIIVLPFENLSGNGNNDYLIAGITYDLTNALSHIPGAFVIAQATASTYREKHEDIRKVGQDLNVRYVVRGSVRRFGRVLRVNAELASTETGGLLWSDSFSQQIADLAAGQEQIVVRMQSALNITLADLEAARSLHERPTNPDAFDLILRARAIPQVSKENITSALRLYEQALEHDPNSVLALVGAAYAATHSHYFRAIPYDIAMQRAMTYVERAQGLAPNSESVLTAQADVLDWLQGGLDGRRARSQLEVVAQKLIDEYPNNPAGYHELGVVRRNTGKYDEAAALFERAIRLDPHGPHATGSYAVSMVLCSVVAGHDREGLVWADRARAWEAGLGPIRQIELLALCAAAYARIGDLHSAKRAAEELNDRFPLHTWRWHSPEDPASEKNVEEYRRLRAAMKTAGVRDHLDPDTDFGVPPDDVLHRYHRKLPDRTPTAALGVTTVSTEQLFAMLKYDGPLVIDTMARTWHSSVPRAIGLDFGGDVHGTFVDDVQGRLERKLSELAGGDTAKAIVTMSFNVAQFDSYNLALRIRHAGYTNVYWYRGGREAWEVYGHPQVKLTRQEW
jgi:adenylate cyclase